MSLPTQSQQHVASPESVTGSSDGNSNLSPRELELQRKRARDRKSQQAMRDRTKWTINSLTEQVTFLTQVLDQRTKDVGLLDARLRILEPENAHLRTQNAALQLSMLGSHQESNGQSPRPESAKNAWELPPLHSAPNCISDQILQGFLSLKRDELLASKNPAMLRGTYTAGPDLCSLISKDRRSDDDISNVVGDIIRSYHEIDTLPQKIAAFYIMFTLTKWMVWLDEQSWHHLPAWMRPTPVQVSTAHAAWIDRIPWPKARDYLVADPRITLDDFAAAYSTSFSVNWPYEPSLVLIPGTGESRQVINPVFEEHLRQLKNWTVGMVFRDRWPELAVLIDSYACPF
ncbi:hypothetical protein GGR57DRAFT_469621 [Xylariaceae sp. FL1272]|nr:hypothetical protein GGR57DRAFT_469621 [Xylariaceae sp. FL1272]